MCQQGLQATSNRMQPKLGYQTIVLEGEVVAHDMMSLSESPTRVLSNIMIRAKLL